MALNPDPIPPAAKASDPIGGPEPGASRWALVMLWGSVAFAGFSLALLISSFFT